MGDVGEDVLRGRDPVWRELWEERLSDDARGRVSRALAAGRAVSDPLEAVLAAGLAYRRHRQALAQLWVLLPAWTVLAVVWLWVTCRAGQPTLSCAVWIAIGVGGAVVGPAVVVTRLRRAARAEAANRAVLDAAATPGL